MPGGVSMQALTSLWPSAGPQTDSLERKQGPPKSTSKPSFWPKSYSFSPGDLLSSHTDVFAGHGLQIPASMPLLLVFPIVGRSLFLLPPNHRLSKAIPFLQSSVQTPHPPKSLPEALSPCAHSEGPEPGC